MASLCQSVSSSFIRVSVASESWFNHEMTPAILLMARLRMIIAERAFFAIGHDDETIAFDPQFHQIISHRFGPLFGEDEVIGRAPPFVAMAFYLDLSPAMRTQPIGIPGEKLSAFLVDRPAIVLEEHIL